MTLRLDALTKLATDNNRRMHLTKAVRASVIGAKVSKQAESDIVERAMRVGFERNPDGIYVTREGKSLFDFISHDLPAYYYTDYTNVKLVETSNQPQRKPMTARERLEDANERLFQTIQRDF